MREINVAPLGARRTTSPCHGGCDTELSLGGARICAILICGICRKDPKKLTAARVENNRHMRAHTIHEQQTNPWYPFPNFHTAWGAA